MLRPKNDSLPPPNAFGLSDRYDLWRPYQADCVLRAIETDKRFVAIVAPTGFGKSIAAEVIARFVGGRSTYVTESKPLQSQVFRDSGRFDVRGKNNYDCLLLHENGITGWQGRCDQAEGLCEDCPLRSGGCKYYDMRRQARLESEIVTNYSMHLAMHRYLGIDSDEGLGQFNLVILDEAHSAADQLNKSLRIELYEPVFERITGGRLLGPGCDMSLWREWAWRHHNVLKPKLDTLQANIRTRTGHVTPQMMRDLGQLKRIVSALSDLSATAGTWIHEPLNSSKQGKGFAFEPLWPTAYGESLFQGAEKVMLMSATLVKKDLEKLGIDMAEVEWMELPSSFPLARRPVYYVKSVQMRANMPESEKLWFVRRGDQFIEPRLQRKGIIHSVSFERARYIQAKSKFAPYMIINEPGSNRPTTEVVEQFKRLPAPAILVSPSVTTGYDFPDAECRWQWLPKIPFPDARNAILAARIKDDPSYRDYLAMKQIVQAAGRGMRSATDWCETVITDNQWGWFRFRAAAFAPQWFLAACGLVTELPTPIDFE